jgi:hypothetical protein
MLTANLHLVPRLRMSGAVSLLPLHAFMARTRMILPLLYIALCTVLEDSNLCFSMKPISTLLESISII